MLSRIHEPYIMHTRVNHDIMIYRPIANTDYYQITHALMIQIDALTTYR